MELSLEELADFAKEFVAELPQEAGSRAHVVGLKGELGAGKTTFVQMVARELGVDVSVGSPTYVFAKKYEIRRVPYRHLVHVDAYRLESHDADTIGWNALLADSENLLLVEWPENLGGFPADAAMIAFTVTGEKTRSLHHHVGDR
jgi:tRNA threonylcarbamoyladenosine biosynthesis protein TsaE